MVESDSITRAHQILHDTTKQIGQRDERELLWKLDKIEMSNSYPMALKRLHGI